MIQPPGTAKIGLVQKGTVSDAVKLIDTNGAEQGVLMEDGAITVRDYLIGIAEGDVANHALFSKLGYSSAAPSGISDVYAANIAYIFPAAAQQMEVVSSSAQDAAAGSGVKTIRIYYLKNDYTEATVDVVLTGTTPLNTSVSDIFRINNVRVIDFGAATTAYQAAGNIDIRNKVSAAIIYSRIALNQTRARNSIYTVPHGKTLYITSFAAGVSKGGSASIGGIITLKATYDDKLSSLLTAGLFFMPYAELNLIDQMYTREFHAPLKFTAHTDIKVSINASQAATVVTSSIRGWLET
jgi:hypothetical protein